MKDHFGTELQIGDLVAFCAPHYRHFVTGEIIKFTPKKVRVRFNNTWNFGQRGHIEEYLTEPENVVRKPTNKIEIVHTGTSEIRRHLGRLQPCRRYNLRINGQVVEQFTEDSAKDFHMTGESFIRFIKKCVEPFEAALGCTATWVELEK